MPINDKSAVALIIFAIVYVIIIAGESSPRKLDRPAAGLIGAVLMVLCGVLTRHEALAAIDFPTLALLFGMMVIVHYATVSGLLDRMAHYLVDFSHSARQLLWTVGLSAGVLSALFVNDTICLLMTPLLLGVVRKAKLPPEPYLISLATSSNVGSLMTITGNPQNMLIGQASGWSWAEFALRMVPVGLVCLLINSLLVQTVYNRSLAGAGDGFGIKSETQPLNKKLVVKTLIVLIGLLVGFLAGAPMDLTAMTAAVVILVLANEPPALAFASIDWALLLFFAGLFVVVEGVTKVEGSAISHFVPMVTSHASSFQGLMIFSGASLAGSNLFGNVPFVMLLRTWLTHIEHAPLLWLALAASSTLAGNLTLVGSVANIIVAQSARDEYDLTFMSFLKVGVISTVITVTVAAGMLAVYNSLGWV